MALRVHDVRTIPHTADRYLGWPTLTRAASGELFIVYSGGRYRHVCPVGQVHLIRSADEGKTWTLPRVIVDGPLDDRDAGILQTRKGTLIVAWFSSVTWLTKDVINAAHMAKLPAEERAEWDRRRQWLTDPVIANELGVWCIRSTDGGHTWSAKIDTVSGSPHGPIQLSDGRLLYPGKHRAPRGTIGKKGGPYAANIGAAESTDDGLTWRWISDINPMPGHESENYHELHGVEANDGRIIVHIRNHNDTHRLETLQTESSDGGRTWSPVHPIGLWGFPAFLMKTRTGRLVTTVGHRREPLGIQISYSDDNGATWSAQTPLTTDSGGDLGYPSTVELADGSLLTLWYDQANAPITRLRLAHWSLD